MCSSCYLHVCYHEFYFWLMSFILSSNEFVFRNNDEFLAYQMQFLPGNAETNWDPLVMPWILAPSNECDYVHLTFEAFDGEYEVINNRALLFKGYKEVIIKGQGLKTNGQKPVLKIINEMTRREGPYRARVRRMVEDETTGEMHPADSIEVYHTLNVDDAIINIQNTSDVKVDVIISDIDIVSGITRDDVEQANLYQGWFRDFGTYLIKVYEASSFKMQNVKTDVRYLNCTNLRLNWSKNVEIFDCDFINYNCRKVGGCLWLEYSAENVRIENNNFHKFGNDEIVAIWLRQDLNRDESEWIKSFSDNEYPAFPQASPIQSFVGVSLIEPVLYPVAQWLARSTRNDYAFRELKLHNVFIDNNRFYYAPPYVGCLPVDVGNFNLHKSETAQEDQWNGVMDIMIATYTAQTRHEGDFLYPFSHISVNSYRVSNNEFFINAPINGLVSLTFDDNVITKDILVSDNVIRYSDWCCEESQLIDFNVHNNSENILGGLIANKGKLNLDPVIIKHNTLVSQCLPYKVRNDNMQEEHSFLKAENSRVRLIENSLFYDSYGHDVPSGVNFPLRNHGVELLLNTRKGASIYLYGNHIEGLKNLCFVENEHYTTPMEIVAVKNTFVGKTHIYIHNLQEGSFVFQDNTFLAYSWLFMFQEFATRGVVYFENNYVKRIRQTGYGEYDQANSFRFFASYSTDVNDTIEQMKIFSKGNEFCFDVTPADQDDNLDAYKNVFPAADGSRLILISAGDKYTVSWRS